MNYNRRSTRPDAGYYRETRKVRRGGGGGARRGGGGKGIHPVAVLALLVAVGVVAWLVFFRR
jgi:hypothetical protein